MTSLASRNPRQQDVGRFRARQRFLVATRAGKARVRAVIESCMRHPSQRDVRRRNARQCNRVARDLCSIARLRDRHFDLSL